MSSHEKEASASMGVESILTPAPACAILIWKFGKSILTLGDYVFAYRVYFTACFRIDTNNTSIDGDD
jgi:hypothetical protein